MTCPHCGEAARFVEYRSRTLLSLLGPMRCERAYYHCKHCHRGTCPSETVLGLSTVDSTPGALEVTCMAGAAASFAGAAAVVLQRMCGLRLSESTAQRHTEVIGHEVGERLNSGSVFGPATAWAWHKDATGQTCAYLAIDATGVPQQGPQARATEGKMATVAMVFNPVPESRAQWAKPTAARPPWQARYVTTLHSQEDLGAVLYRQAVQVGIGQAQCLIALSDGGAGLEDWLRRHFPRVTVVILDFYHASEHLADLAKAWHGAGTAAAETQHQQWAHRLKHEGGQAVLEELRTLVLPARDSLREVWRATVTYFENQVHRMDYPRYRARGWQIGSGSVEAACKTVIGQRLKGTGMRWCLTGSDGVAHLRALLLGERGQWGTYWEHRRSVATSPPDRQRKAA